MTTIVPSEIICIVFLVILLLYQFADNDTIKSAKILRVNTVAVLLWLLMDASSLGTNQSFFPTFLSYVWGNFVALIFLQYCSAYIGEKTKLKKWTFLVPEILCLINAVVAALFFISGNIVVYENGVATQDAGVPVILQVSQGIVVLFPPVVAFLKRKSAGLRSLFLMGFFAFVPLIATVAYKWTENDYTVTLCAIAQMAVVTLLQNERRRFNFEEHIANKALAENSIRFFVLEDKFESLYDVDLESGNYVSFDRGEFYQRNIREKLVSPTKFFENMRENVDRVVYEEDREETFNIQQKENIIKALAEKDHIDHYYRIITENGQMWLKMRIVYKNEERKNVVIGVFNAEEEIATKRKEEQFKQELMQTNARLFALEDNFESLYDVSLENGHYDFFVKGDFFRDKVLKKLSVPKDYFAELRRNIDAVIYPEDRDGLYKALDRDSIRKQLETSERFDYYYRLDSDNGPIWFKMRVVYKDAEKKNVIIGVFNAAKDVEAKQIAEQKAEIEESLTFTNFFLDTYVSAYYVDLNTFSCKVYKRTSELDKEYPIFTNYMDSLVEYINHDVHPEDRKDLLDAVQPEKMKATLREKSEYNRIFRDISGGVEKVYRLQVIRGSEENKAAFGFTDITNEVNDQNNRQKEAEESKKLIDSIAASYNVAYAVNMVTDEFKLLRMDKSIIGYDKSFSSFKEAKEFFIGLLPEFDRKGMRHELDYQTIREKLKRNRSYDVEYRLPINKAMIWHVMNITVIDGDYITIGFANRDLEITQKHLEDKRYSEYFALYEIDIESGMMKVVKDSPYYEINRSGTAMLYKPAMLKFASCLDAEPREFFEKMADLEYVKEQFATEDKRTFAYRSNNVGDKNWVDCTSYVTLRHSDGTPAMFTFGFSLLDSLGVYRQELQQKFVEQNAVLVFQQEQLEDAREAADAANQAKTNFLFNMSHDIRTPMNAIRGFTSMAKKNVGNESKVIEYLDKIDISGQQLLALINQVLEMARIDSGKVEFEEKPVNIQEEFNSMVTVLSEQANTKGLKFNYSFGDVSHNNVLADEARIGSIVLNIVGNAMKYTPEGGTIDFSLREIQCRKPGFASFVMTVSDTGIGMSEEYLKELYEPFSREKSSTVSKIQGTGLGMSIVKNIIDLLGGSIDVHSEIDKGTRFEVTIDFRIDEKAEKVVVEEDLSKVSFKGRRVLLVEDNEMNREIAKDMLEEQGVEVEDAEDGDVAVAKVKDIFDRGEFHYYDFILMDVQMPRMNGYEATKAIRKIMVNGVHIPIIAMTANAFEEDRENAIDAGMDEHLAKPIDVQTMFMKIAKFLM